MADINSELLGRHRAPVDQSPGRSPTPDSDPHLVTFVELLFFAYRDFTREADAALAEFGLGRAHHRVLHFVNRNPGLRVADLLEILKITKQSLARVLKELVDEGSNSPGVSTAYRPSASPKPWSTRVAGLMELRLASCST
jgi:hypothetical protein